MNKRIIHNHPGSGLQKLEKQMAGYLKELGIK